MNTKTKKTRSVTFRIEEEDYEALKKFAEKRERTISFVLNKFTKKALSQNQNSENSQDFFEPVGLPTLKLSDEDTKRIEDQLDKYYSEKKAGYKHKSFLSAEDLINYLDRLDEE